MAKKKRERSTIAASDDLSPVDVAESTSSTSSASIDASELDDLLAGEEATEEKLVAKILPSTASSEMKEKIETLEKHCVELEEANAKMTDSINAYLEEIDALKKAKSADSSAGESVEDLKKALDAANAEIAKLKNSAKDLRKENDDYLMKISELTFENAKMTSQLQEVKKSLSMAGAPTHGDPKSAVVKPSIATMPNQPQFANPYLQNGYQDW